VNSPNKPSQDVPKPAVISSDGVLRRHSQYWLYESWPCRMQDGENDMSIQRYSRFVVHSVVLVTLVAGGQPGFGRDKNETIDAQAFGTGTQLGQNIGVTLNIYEFSTPEDKQVLVQAYQQGQNKGLVNALKKMRAVGHVEITGTLGYDCSYIRVFPTPTGRKIVFATNRQISMAEAWTDSNSMSFDLTAGILDLNDKDKGKSTGVLYPAAQLVLNKEGEVQWDLAQNPWRLAGLHDWAGTAGVN
jgi:hypothetical protein